MERNWAGTDPSFGHPVRRFPLEGRVERDHQPGFSQLAISEIRGFDCPAAMGATLDQVVGYETYACQG